MSGVCGERQVAWLWVAGVQPHSSGWPRQLLLAAAHAVQPWKIRGFRKAETRCGETRNVLSRDRPPREHADAPWPLGLARAHCADRTPLSRAPRPRPPNVPRTPLLSLTAPPNPSRFHDAFPIGGWRVVGQCLTVDRSTRSSRCSGANLLSKSCFARSRSISEAAASTDDTCSASSDTISHCTLPSFCAAA